MLITVILCMGLGLLMGLFQGSIIARLSVPPFIVTLGGLYIFKSGILLVTQGKSLFISSNDTYKFIAQGLIPPLDGFILAALVAAALFVRVFLARARKLKYGIALSSLAVDLLKAGLFAALVMGYVIVVNRTFDGEAEEIYVIMGALMGVSGIALAAYVGSGTTGAGGGYELDVIASCILGGTSTLGGEGTVFGAIVGALIIQSLSNGLQMMNVSSNVQYLIKGLVLILAVLADISMKKKRA